MIKKGIVSLVCCLLFISFLPVSVFAAGQTYIDFSGCIAISSSMTRNTFVLDINGNARLILLGSTNNYKLYAISDSPFTYKDTFYNGASCPYNGGSYSNPGHSTGYYAIEFQNFAIQYYAGSDIPKVSDEASIAKAIYYTYGEGAVDPVEPVNWGILRDVRYDTNIAGNGLAGSNNIDYLSWNKFVDTNNNDISNMHVEVQAVPGYWRGEDYQSYISKNYNDFDNGSLSPVSLGSISVSLGGFSISWSAVISKFGFSDTAIFASVKNAIWESIGWYYQIRLVTDDGYIGEWQTIYNVTSASSEGIQNILNHNEFNSTTNSYLQTITQINNQETVNITYNDTTITIENPDVNPEPEGGTNLWDVLKQLVNGLYQLLAKIGKMVGDLLDGLIGLIRDLVTPPAEIDNSINVEITNNLDSYIQEKQPALYEINQGIRDLEQEMRTIANNTTGQCIITWDPVIIDLSYFGAGTVTFIQGGTHDFGRTFIQFINAFGMSYDDYKLLVSAVIYILLIVYINRKIVQFLR